MKHDPTMVIPVDTSEKFLCELYQLLKASQQARNCTSTDLISDARSLTVINAAIDEKHGATINLVVLPYKCSWRCMAVVSCGIESCD